MTFKKIILYESILNKKLEIKLKKKFILKKIKNIDQKKFYFDSVFALFIKLENKLGPKLLGKFKNLTYIISPTTGLTHIDQIFCKKKKIRIISLKSNDIEVKKITATAEYNLSLILISIRSPHKFFTLTKKKIWNRYNFPSKQFYNYYVGIIGFGRIGKKLSKYLKNLNFKVINYDNKIHSKNKLNKLLKFSDIISLNINYNKNNYNFVNQGFLKKCKKDVKIINTSRGEIINESHLLNFLKKNSKAEAYLDCIKNEQNRISDNHLFKKNNDYKNLFISPHVGGSCIDAIKKTEEIVVNKFMRYEKN